MIKQLLTAVCAFTLISAPAIARPPPGANIDPDTQQWYQSLTVPQTGGGCCSIADCRPTDLRLTADGLHWQAFISKELYGATAPDQWVDIPQDKILQHKSNPTGRVVICWYDNQIYCAVLPSLT